MASLELRAFDALAAHPRLSDLATATRKVADRAWKERRLDPPGPLPAEGGDGAPLVLMGAEAETEFGLPLTVLEQGPTTTSERALACALWAHAVAEGRTEDEEDEPALAAQVLWLAAHSAFDATMLLDRALGDDAGTLWEAVAARVRSIVAAPAADTTWSEAFVGVNALSTSSSSTAAVKLRSLAGDLRGTPLASWAAPLDAVRPSKARLATWAAPQTGAAAPRAAASPADASFLLSGELAAAPRGLLATTLLAFSGILLVVHGVSLLARFTLAYRRPAEVTMTRGGVRVQSRTILLGRTIREREAVFLRETLVRATREVRYPHLAFYAGLLALAFGSYVGVSLLVDGARAASPSLLLTGFLIVAAGVLLDLLLGSLMPGAAGRCRVVFVPLKGASLCVSRVAADRADAVLARLASP